MNRLNLVSLTFATLPFAYTAWVYGALPEVIPIHFDWRGQPDDWGAKYLIWLAPSVLIPLVLTVNATFLNSVVDDESGEKAQSVGLIMLVFTSSFLCYLTYRATPGSSTELNGLAVLLGGFFAALGNYLPVIKQNFWIGIRVPPTLSSGVKWTKTHRFAGKVFLASGLAMLVAGLTARGPIVAQITVSAIATILFTSVVYPYTLPDDPRDDLA